jgi:ankyrin repeat protein
MPTLMEYAFNGNLKALQELLKEENAGVLLRHSCRLGMGVYHYAALGNSVDVVKYLIAIYPSGAGAVDHRGHTVWDCAARNAHGEIMALLLAQGSVLAQPKIITTDVMMLLAAQTGGRHTMEDLYNIFDVPYTVTTEVSGLSVLHMAARAGWSELVLWLLTRDDMRAIVDRQDDYHKATALFLAAGNGHLGAVRVLCEEGGADTTLLAVGTVRATTVARESGHCDTFRYLTAHFERTAPAGPFIDAPTLQKLLTFFMESTGSTQELEDLIRNARINGHSQTLGGHSLLHIAAAASNEFKYTNFCYDLNPSAAEFKDNHGMTPHHRNVMQLKQHVFMCMQLTDEWLRPRMMPSHPNSDMILATCSKDLNGLTMYGVSSKGTPC